MTALQGVALSETGFFQNRGVGTLGVWPPNRAAAMLNRKPNQDMPMVDPEKYNKARADIQAVRTARVVTFVLGAMALFNGEAMGAVIMAVVWLLLHFALPVTH